MKFRILFIALFSALLVAPAVAQTPVTQTLGDGWEFRQKRGYNWYPATVPGVVHTDLMAAGIIEDPFFRLNERGVQWVDKEDWIYRTRFDMEAEVFARQNIELTFEGLDTYADVTLNGEKIVTADNMFRSWTADVKRLLKEKDNELEVYFHSPVKVAMPMWEATPWRDIIESGNDQSAQGGLLNARIGVFVRKAGYHFGWDWGPRLVTSGIWRPVVLAGWDDVRIDDVFYRQVSVTKERAVVNVTVTADVARSVRNAEIVVRNNSDGRVVARRKATLAGPQAQTELEFTMNNPRLWWTNGLGEPYLYNFSTEIVVGGKVVDRHDQKLGIRSIRVITEPDRWGESFYFELNGVPVFMKGANVIPLDNFLPRITEEDYERHVRDAAAVHMNMLRVWGGGIYEDKAFYDLCDRYGILVWQDFMFSCALYPAEGELLENIRHEAVENVRRLRNHACMAVWCGNNECLDMWFHWGVKRRYDRTNPEWSAIQWKQFTDLYYKVLPEVVAEHHPGICYRKSSPYSDDQGMRSDSIGDYHDWDVWGQALEFDRYNHKMSRFFSEYGFQGFPSFQSVQRFAPEERDWSATSEVMLSHQRAGTNGNQKIDKMMARDYGEPRDFACFTYMSQLMQADAMKIAMEAHRRQMPRCMGSLIWQHNDCWPVASWSSRDWYGNWKAQQYAIQRAFDDILISAFVDGDKISFHAVTDRLKRTPATIRISIRDLQGNELKCEEWNQELKLNTSQKIFSIDMADIADPANTVIYSTISVPGDGAEEKVYENFFYLAKHKDINYPQPYIQADYIGITDGETGTCGGYDVTLWSDVVARGVYLGVDGIDDYHFSDNFFDLLPGERKTVRLLLNQGVYEIENQLSIMTLGDARK